MRPHIFSHSLAFKTIEYDEYFVHIKITESIAAIGRIFAYSTYNIVNVLLRYLMLFKDW